MTALLKALFISIGLLLPLAPVASEELDEPGTCQMEDVCRPPICWENCGDDEEPTEEKLLCTDNDCPAVDTAQQQVVSSD